jgi:shikimate kinase
VALAGNDNRHLFLVGFMGCGKSTVAPLVAARMERPCIELDDVIEGLAGCSIADLFATGREQDFRRLEAESLERLDGKPGSIVATGGGAFLAFANRQQMRRIGETAWLDVSLEEARRRVGDGGGRPLWQKDDRVAFRALFERRRACYALAGYRFLTTKKPPKIVAIDVFDCFDGIF